MQLHCNVLGWVVALSCMGTVWFLLNMAIQIISDIFQLSFVKTMFVMIKTLLHVKDSENTIQTAY